jgi:hypothetical protein
METVMVKMSPRVNSHIYRNHVVIQKNKSTFFNIRSADLAIYSTLCSGHITLNGDRFVIESNFNWPVGFECENTRYSCRVVLDKNGEIITAFPIK